MRVGRRGFFGAVAAALAGAAAAQVPTPLFAEPVAAGAVGEFIQVVWFVEMTCLQPRKQRVIYGISGG